MEYVRKALAVNLNSKFFIWCFTLPIAAFVVTLSLGTVLADTVTQPGFNSRSVSEFLRYYDRYLLREFMIIFSNNYFAALVVVYFTPLALGLRRFWGRWRGKNTPLSRLEQALLYLFPAIFLVRQAVNIAVVLSGLAGPMSKNILVSFAGLILPHGLPELAAFSLAGALGMEVTHKLFNSVDSGRVVNARVLVILTTVFAFCAFLEVYFTPRVFALLVGATNNI